MAKGTAARTYLARFQPAHNGYVMTSVSGPQVGNDCTFEIFSVCQARFGDIWFNLDSFGGGRWAGVGQKRIMPP
jgi:hypothetical protein